MPDILDDYEVVPDRARVMTEYLIKIYDKMLGDAEVTDLNSDSTIAFIEILLRVWKDLFPDEYQGRIDQQKTDWLVERSVADANKADGGYFVVSFPPRVWYMLKIFFPNIKWTDRKVSNVLTSNFPILKGTQYKT